MDVDVEKQQRRQQQQQQKQQNPFSQSGLTNSGTEAASLPQEREREREREKTTGESDTRNIWAAVMRSRVERTRTERGEPLPVRFKGVFPYTEGALGGANPQ